MGENTRKVMQSLSACAFALSVFASNAGNVSADVMDKLVDGYSSAVTKRADNEESADDITSMYNFDGNNDNPDGITTTYHAVYGDGVFGRASDFSVFSQGSFTSTGTSCAGNLAAGGNISVSDDYNTPSAVAGADITGGSFRHGYLSRDEAAVDFDREFAKLRKISTALSAIPANGTISTGTWNGEILFTGTDFILNVFTVSAEEFNRLVSDAYGMFCFRFDVPYGSQVLVNITGRDGVNLGVTAGTYYCGTAVKEGTSNNGDILFNVTESESVAINTSIGCVLAPESVATSVMPFGTPHFEGQLICKAYFGNNEFGCTPFVNSNRRINKVIKQAAESYDEEEIVTVVSDGADHSADYEEKTAAEEKTVSEPEIVIKPIEIKEAVLSNDFYTDVDSCDAPLEAFDSIMMGEDERYDISYVSEWPEEEKAVDMPDVEVENVRRRVYNEDKYN